MLLDRQNDTPLDLRFRIFGVSVRVHPFFWLMTAFINFELLTKDGPDVLLVWILCVFVSILLHELGHVWMGQIFGTRGHIFMQGFCGMAVGATSGVGERWKRIAVYLAGPGIQFLFFGVLVTLLIIFDGRPAGKVEGGYAQLWHGDRIDFVDRFADYVSGLTEQPGWPRLVTFAVHFLLSINIWWPIINLLPIWPLDGGQVSRELFTWQSSIYGVRNSLALSFAAAVVVTINALSSAMQGPRIPYLPSGGRFFILFFAIFAFESFMLLQMEVARTRSGWRDPDDDDRLPWERDPDEWKRG